MINRQKIVVAILTLFTLMFAVLYFSTRKKLHDYADHVNLSSQTFIFRSSSIQMQIDDLEELKSDTSYDRERQYQFIKEDFEQQNAFTLFTFAVSVNETEENQQELNSLIHQYSLAIKPIRSFYIEHDSLSQVESTDLESLIFFYKDLKSLTEKFESLPVNL